MVTSFKSPKKTLSHSIFSKSRGFFSFVNCWKMQKVILQILRSNAFFSHYDFTTIALQTLHSNHCKKVFFRLTQFYMGFWRYVNTWGGVKLPPPPSLIQSKKNDWNLVKRHVLAKIDCFCPLSMLLE